MKTVILCGGQGTRLREETEFRPKAMVEVGGLPMIIHIMNIYAKYGHKEFVLCLGYKGEKIREYFLNLPHYADDIELDLKTHEVRTIKKRAKYNFVVSFVDTGLTADTAERILRAVRTFDDEQFMIAYGDDVSDIDISKLLRFHDRKCKKERTCATLTAAHPSSQFGQIQADKRDVIRRFEEKPMLSDYVNGGFMVFNRDAISYLKRGETLERGLERMAIGKKLAQYRHEGFWHGMNTMKDVVYLNALWRKGRPWVV